MQNAFYGRKKELNRLEKRYSSGKFELAVVHGRRRVGKTRLISEFMTGKQGLFFTARDVSAEENLELLSKQVFGEDSPRRSFEDVLAEMADRAAEERYVFVIDEYPRLARRGSGVTEALKAAVPGMKGSKLYLVLIGSSSSTIRRDLLEPEPVYDRAREYRLKPFDYFQSRQFLEGFDEADMVRIYAITGGVPHYLLKFDPDLELAENVARNLLVPDLLNGEATAILDQDFVRPVSYGRVIAAIAGGCTRVSDISGRTGMSTPAASEYLRDLIDAGIVKRVRPVDNCSGNVTRHRVSDAYLRFHYRYVSGFDENWDEDELLRAVRSALVGLDSEISPVFDKICAQFFAKSWGGKSGTWWGPSPVDRRTEEIGLVMTREDDGGVVGLFVEGVFSDQPAGVEALEGLVRRAALVKGYDRKEYAVCSLSGFTEGLEAMEDVTLLTLDDMVGKAYWV